MNHTTMKLTFHQMHDLLRMVDKIVTFKKHVIPRYGRNHPHVHKGKTNQQLETLSLSSVRKLMLPYLATARHNLYTRSVGLYLQSMSSLETDHPDVYRKFEAGFHVVRRSNLL